VTIYARGHSDAILYSNVIAATLDVYYCVLTYTCKLLCANRVEINDLRITMAKELLDLVILFYSFFPIEHRPTANMAVWFYTHLDGVVATHLGSFRT